MRIKKRALTFEDVLLVPQHSLVLPKEVCLKSQLTKRVSLNIHIVAPLDNCGQIPSYLGCQFVHGMHTFCAHRLMFQVVQGK